MKKVIQIISVFVLAVMVSTILCSCIQLDDLKNNRAVFLNDDKTEVLFRDNLYKRIQLKGEAIIQNETYDGRLTAADVPILLAESEGSAFSYDKTADVPTLLKQYYENYSSAYDGTKVYCLESEYDRISEINSSDKFDSMYIIYSKDYSDEDMVGYNHDYQLVYEIVSEEYHDAIDRALESDTETLIDSEEGAKSEYLDLTRCDSDMLLTNNATIHIEYIDNEYYVQESTNYRFKKVSEDNKEIFKRMFKEYDEKGAVYSSVYPEMIEGY